MNVSPIASDFVADSSIRRGVLLCGLSLLMAVPSLAADESELPPAVDRQVDFKADVLPILEARCFECHSGEKHQSGLRLDVRDLALQGGDSGVAMNAGDSAGSLLIELVVGLDEDRIMPPEGDRLTEDEVGILRAWIDQGVTWPADSRPVETASAHWAYQPLSADAPPVVNSPWVRNDIDRFILAALQEHGVQPAPEADRHTLIRRLYLDLLGLPPMPAEADAFVRDDSPQAYEKLVDRLLASPHFGERWGRHWLDHARYADSDGYEKDRPRPNAWRWRDWAIQAINDDMPFDQFTIEQLAGDLLPDADESQRLATAFHRQTLTNTEGGTDQEQFRVEACFDRVETTGTVWLGLTIGCARCHSHKYDQISQREYFQLFAFINNGDETSANVSVSPEAVAKYESDLSAWQSNLQVTQDELAAAKQRLPDALRAWEAEWKIRVAAASDQRVEFHVIEFTTREASSKADIDRQGDGSYLVTGPLADKDEYTLTAKLPAGLIAETRGGLTGLRIESIPDERLPSKGAGRAPNGNFVLSDLRVYLGPTGKLNTQDHSVALQAAVTDFHQDKFPPDHVLDADKQRTGWAVAPQMQQAHELTVLTQQPMAMPDEAWLQVVLDQQYGGTHTLGRFRVSIRTGRDPRDGIPTDVLVILDLAAESRTKAQQQRLLDWYATQSEVTAPLLKRLADQQAAQPKRPEMSVAVITQRTNNPRTTHVMRRGDFLDPITETVIPAGTLSVLPPLKARSADRPDRLDLARWLVSADNPLTPRVAANHAWKHLFGNGIVATENDFGARGERPSHPQLLDWLARQYRTTHGWSRKALIRQIVLSATYRQSSVHRPELAESDPQNRWLARQNRLRVEGEVVRDLSLAVSGLLSPKVGGPSVFPPLPPGVAELSYANNFRWDTSKGEDRYRRGMYTFFKRTAPHPNLTAFDCPDANTTCVERQTSNTPLQALILLNNEVYVESAQAFARRLLSSDIPSSGSAGHDSSTDQQRLDYGFRLCVTRPMSTSEATQFADLLQMSRRWYADHPDDAKLLAGTAATGSTLPETAAWIATCRVMLNLDEFVTRN